jgi:uncharacterized membrane protein
VGALPWFSFFDDRFDRSGRKALRAQPHPGRDVDADANQQRREAAVFAAGERDFGLDGRAEIVAGMREARDRDGPALTVTMVAAHASAGKTSVARPSMT